MTQKELPFAAAERASDAIDAAEELPRVADGIKAHVHAFLAGVIADACHGFRRGGLDFRAQELCDYVVKRKQCAPGSPDRVMRHAIRQGWAIVQTVNKPQSLYRVCAISPLTEWVEKPRTEAEKCHDLVIYHDRMADRYRARLAEIEESS